MESFKEDMFKKYRPYPCTTTFDIEYVLKSKIIHNTWGEIYRNIVTNIEYEIDKINEKYS